MPTGLPIELYKELSVDDFKQYFMEYSSALFFAKAGESIPNERVSEKYSACSNQDAKRHRTKEVGKTK